MGQEPGCNDDDLLMAPLSLDAGQRQAWAKLLQPDFTKLPFGFDSLAVCPAHFHPHQIVENSVKDAQVGVEFSTVSSYFPFPEFNTFVMNFGFFYGTFKKA